MDRYQVELRARVEGNTLSGHAAVFDQVARIAPGRYETLARGAFDTALKTSDVRLLMNHDPSMLLARQKAGTLKVWSDDEGLAFEADLPDTQVAHDVRELVKRGDLDGGSFGFIPGGADGQKRSRIAEGTLVTHTQLRSLLDVSVVTYPAYDGAGVQLRTMDLEPLQGRVQLLLARHRVHLTKGVTV